MTWHDQFECDKLPDQGDCVSRSKMHWLIVEKKYESLYLVGELGETYRGMNNGQTPPSSQRMRTIFLL